MQDALTKLGARASSLEADLAKANLQISSQEVLTCIRLRVSDTVEIETKSLNRHCQLAVFVQSTVPLDVLGWCCKSM